MWGAVRRRAWGAVRRAKRRRRYRDKFDAVPATFEMVVAEPASLRRIRWAHLDADEGHRHTFVTRGYWRSCTRCTPSFAPLASVPILYRAPRASRALIVQDGPPRQAAAQAQGLGQCQRAARRAVETRPVRRWPILRSCLPLRWRRVAAAARPAAMAVAGNAAGQSARWGLRTLTTAERAS